MVSGSSLLVGPYTACFFRQHFGTFGGKYVEELLMKRKFFGQYHEWCYGHF